MATLIIVCCHSVFHGTDPYNAHHWALAPFQQATATKPAEHLTFIEHIKAALTELDKDLARCSTVDNQAKTLVVFSGGFTNANHLSVSEAGGYSQVAKRLLQAANDDGNDDKNVGVFSTSQPLLDHLVIEEYATDLYQNILFALLRYNDIQGTWPDDIKVVTHAFKAERVQLHAQAIRWTRKLDVIGIDPPFSDDDRSQVEKLEKRNARAPFEVDPYGAQSPLRDKRIARLWDDNCVNAIAKRHEKSIKALLAWTGGSTGSEQFPGDLPWNRAEL